MKLLSMNISNMYSNNYTFEDKKFICVYLFKLLNAFYYIYSCIVIITTQFYSIPIPNPKCIPPFPNLSHLENISFSKSVNQYLFCKGVQSVLYLYSTCQ